MTSPLAMLAAATPTPAGRPSGTSAPEPGTARDGDDASSFSDIMARQRAGQDAAATSAGGGAPTSAPSAGAPGAVDPAAAADGGAAADGKHDDKPDLAGATPSEPTLAQQALALAAMAAQLHAAGTTAAAAANSHATRAGQPLPGQAAASTGTSASLPASPGDAAQAAAAATVAAASADGANASAQAAASSLPTLPGAGTGAVTPSPATAESAQPAGAAHEAARPSAGDARTAARQSDEAVAARAALADAGAGTDNRPDAHARGAEALKPLDALKALSADKDAAVDSKAASAPRDTLHQLEPAAPSDMAQALAGAWQAPVASTGGQVASASAIRTPVGQAQWGTELGGQLVMMTRHAGEDAQTAQLRLDPPDLGPLQVTIKITDGVAQASFVSAHAAVRQALESALPQLQQTLAQAGISLGQTSVSDQGAQAGFGGMQQGNDRGSGQGGGQAANASADTAGEVVQIAVPTRRAGAGIVDTFA
jgi:flagellar hook-length control protein FliK